MFCFFFGEGAADAERGRERRARLVPSPMQIPHAFRLRAMRSPDPWVGLMDAAGGTETELYGLRARSIVMRASGALLLRDGEVAGDSDEVLELLRIDERVTAIRCGDQLLIRPRCAEPAGWCAVVSP